MFYSLKTKSATAPVTNEGEWEEFLKDKKGKYTYESK